MSATAEAIRYVREFVLERSAIVVEPGKEYLVESRLGPLAREAGLNDIDSLVSQVKGDPTGPLARRMVEAMTTNETSFFRDLHPWEALKKVLLPELVERGRATKTVKIWCAAASTGQEPYTIAMTLRESLPDFAAWRVEIVATDLNAAVLERARRGVYSQLEVNRGLPAPMLVRYFTREGVEWVIKPELRSMVTFRELNLVGSAPMPSGNDIVFMRNVLIYFDLETKRQILSRVRDALVPRGTLFLGGAETTISLVDSFDNRRIGNTIVYRAKDGGGAMKGTHAPR